MIQDKAAPLYTMTIGEFIELTRQTVQAVLSEHATVSTESSEDEHFSIAECARFLKCSLVSIHNYKKKGLPYYKMGRKILFKKNEVLAFMKNATKRLCNLAKKKAQ